MFPLGGVMCADESGFCVADGLDDTTFVDNEGDVWHTDEYGDRSYMWDYR